jgi:hypothetical protein
MTGRIWVSMVKGEIQNTLCGLSTAAESNSAEQKMHLETVLVFIFIKNICSLLSVF